MKKENIGYGLLILLAVAGIIVLATLPPIEQNEAFHNFSDKRTIWGIPNFWNVISNLPFLVCGVWGLLKLNVFREGKLQYAIFFLGIALVAFGSGYYHWEPTNERLVWDRLPMTIAFMALLSIVISEFVNAKAGKMMLVPLLLIGFVSILIWAFFDDLRLYGFVQFYPILAMPVILLCFPSRYTMVYGYWLLFLGYLLAKVFEKYDHEIHDTLKFISGHSLKHIAAAVGLIILKRTYLKRKNYDKK